MLSILPMSDLSQGSKFHYLKSIPYTFKWVNLLFMKHFYNFEKQSEFKTWGVYMWKNIH